MDDRREYDPAQTRPLGRFHKADAHLGFVLLVDGRDIERALHALERGLHACPVAQVAHGDLGSSVAARRAGLFLRANEPSGRNAPPRKRRHHQSGKAPGRANHEDVRRFGHVDLPAW